MKYVLLSIFLALCAATVVDHFSRESTRSEVPVLYWVTAINTARVEQVELFHEWLEEKGYPKFELRLDGTNTDASKKLIQGVSGVGADIVSMARDEAWLFHATGMMEDLRPWAEKHGFTLDKTWPASVQAYMMDGEQVGFPRANPVQIHILNVGLLEKHGQPLPPRRWTIEEFEEAGKSFVAAANEGKERQTIFFADMINVYTLIRSMGRSVLNETMTRSTVNTPEVIRGMKLIRKWTFEDRIIPTQADLDFATGSDTNTSRIQLFARGRYALLTGARYSMVQLREHPEIKLGVRPTPHDIFPNALLGTGSVGIYKKSAHKELAAYVLEFFTSEPYNMHMVRNADAMPPIPRYTRTEEFLNPKGRPNEKGVHGEIASIMEMAIQPCVSPFILPTSLNRIQREYRLGVMADIYSPEEGMALSEAAINHEIDLNVESHPKLQQEYAKLIKDQEIIDQLRAEGKPVPLSLITNPFYRSYYVAQGWTTDQ